MAKKIAKMLATYPKVNFEKLWDKIVDFDVISFDAFNTLLKLDVAQRNDVFKLIEQEWNKQHTQKLVNFSQKRQVAEKKAQQKWGSKLNLAHIYQELNVPKEVANLEYKMERKLNRANEPLLEIFKSLQKMGKRIVIIADMYLDKSQVATILADAGYYGYEKLYVSSEYKVDKASGEIFNHVLQELDIKNDKIIHVGDNKKTDGAGTKKVGIEWFRLPQIVKQVKLPATNNFALSSVQTFINNQMAKYEFDDYQTFGYSIFGPIILGFSQWLAKATIKQEQKIFFLARDGFVLKEAFNRLYPDKKTEYMYVSRRALQVPLLVKAKTLADILDVIKIADKFTEEQFLSACGINDYKQTTTPKLLTRDVNNQDLINLYNKHREAITKQAQNEFNTIKQYLQQINFSGDIALVDVGWHGNKQRALSQLCEQLQRNVTLSGYYFGVAQNDKQQKIMEEGFWFDQNKDGDQENLAYPVRGLLEFLFSANEGSTVSYKVVADQVVPILADYEYTDEHELIIQGHLLRTIRQAALQFIEDFANSGLNSLVVLDAKAATTQFECEFFKPTNLIMAQYGHFIFIDRNVKYLVEPHSNIYYLFHLRQFKRDFLISQWPIGLLKKIIKLPLNYGQLYFYLMKHFDKEHNLGGINGKKGYN